MDHSEHHHHEQNVAHDRHAGHSVADFKKRFWVSLILTIPVLVLSETIQVFFHFKLSFLGDKYLLFILASIIFFYGGWPFSKGFIAELKAKKPGMMMLVAEAITVAYLYSAAITFGLSGMVFYWELATLIDVMLLGHWLEMRSVTSAGGALEELAKLLPALAHRLDNGRSSDIALRDLKIGDKILIKPGEKIPADSLILKGETTVDEAMLTGESKPIVKKIGDELIAGSINAEGSVTAEVRKIGEGSYLAEVIKLVRQAQSSKSKTQNLADKAAMYLVIIATLCGVLTFLAWFLATHQTTPFILERAITVVVIACPHALGLAIPLVVAISITLAAKNGFIIKNRSAFESSRAIDTVVFDKTGTLTLGRFTIAEIRVLDSKFNQTQILKYAASLEARSEHPMAKVIAASTKARFEVENFRALPGRGVEGVIGKQKIQVVGENYLLENKIGYDKKAQSGTVIYLIIDKKPVAVLVLEDRIRSESFEAIKRLKAMGIKTVLLTGDSFAVAKKVAQKLKINQFFGEVLPDKKSQKIQELQAKGLKVAMVGDGVNDAPALAQADIGIAIGAGTDVAQAAADIVLVKNNPLDVVKIIQLAKRTYAKMIQNLIWGAGYNIVAIPLAAGVLHRFGILLSPAIGAALMSLSTIIVAINARLLKIK